MERCIYTGCEQTPEWEHALLYGGKQINEAWAIIPACAYHHRGAGLDKDYNRYVAINRASDDDLAKYPKVDWEQLKKSLNERYGRPETTEYWRTLGQGE